MKTLILLLSFFAPLVLAETVPANMLHTSMQSIHKRSDLIVNVTMQHSLEDYKTFVISDSFSSKLPETKPVWENYMLHQASVKDILKSGDNPFIHNEGDIVVIEQWRDIESGLTYEGVPVLQQGEKYLLYLYYTHGKTKEGQPIYAVTGINGGIFSRSDGQNYRQTENTTRLQYTSGGWN